MKRKILAWLTMCGALLPVFCPAQVNSGSNGSDGAFNPTTNTVINMADHPDGIYQYTSVNFSSGVTVTFIPNAANTPVVWLVQSNCTINGAIFLFGQPTCSGGIGGVGGFRGGNMGGGGASPGDGLGPGGGTASPSIPLFGGNASFATVGTVQTNSQAPAGAKYGNQFCVPLIGGSGGGGGFGYNGGGGGGAILIACSGSIQLNGYIHAYGGGLNCSSGNGGGGSGSGGAVRFIATHLVGAGQIECGGGTGLQRAGDGFIRLDSPDNLFSGTVNGQVSRGYQPIIIPPPNQAVSLAIQSVGGIAVPQSPTGAPPTPDVIIPGQQGNPFSIVVRCVNIPLNTDIIVDVKPANGATIRTVGLNNVGTQASSTATVSITMPRGAGTIQAKAVSGIAGSLGASLNNGEKFRHYAQTGLTADGELFEKMEITATLGSGQEIAYLTESGKRFVLPRN